MGLFTKRSTDPGELDRLRSEIAAMAARLDAADSEKAHLEQRLQHLSNVVQQPPPPPRPTPPPPPPVISKGEVDMMRARIQRLYDRLDDPAAQPLDPAAVAALEARVDTLARELADATNAPEPAPTIDPADYDTLRSRVDALQERLDAAAARTTAPPPPPVPTAPPAPAVEPAELDDIRTRIEALHDRVTTMDARITSISTELANQLTELAGDVDALSRREPAGVSDETDPEVTAEVVDEIRDAQLRLANEQARYQIAFRQELADLAERLRRS